jgi:hypothetical protein
MLSKAMFIASSVSMAILVTVAGCAIAPSTAMAQGADDPPRSTTDTFEYCDHLVKRFGAEIPSRSRHPRAIVLANEGQRLCLQGHTRPGILRLRRALMLLDEPEDQGAPPPPG